MTAFPFGPLHHRPFVSDELASLASSGLPFLRSSLYNSSLQDHHGVCSIYRGGVLALNPQLLPTHSSRLHDPPLHLPILSPRKSSRTALLSPRTPKHNSNKNPVHHLPMASILASRRQNEPPKLPLQHQRPRSLVHHGDRRPTKPDVQSVPGLAILHRAPSS